MGDPDGASHSQDRTGSAGEPVLPYAQTYDELRAQFRWDVPQFYNIAADICDRWADGSGRLALIHEKRDGRIDRYSFDDFRRLSNRAANLFTARGLGAGDRIGILLGQDPQTPITHLAAYRIVAIAVPLFSLFGPDSLHY